MPSFGAFYAQLPTSPQPLWLRHCDALGALVSQGLRPGNIYCCFHALFPSTDTSKKQLGLLPELFPGICRCQVSEAWKHGKELETKKPCCHQQIKLLSVKPDSGLSSPIILHCSYSLPVLLRPRPFQHLQSSLWVEVIMPSLSFYFWTWISSVYSILTRKHFISILFWAWTCIHSPGQHEKSSSFKTKHFCCFWNKTTLTKTSLNIISDSNRFIE